jgi:hypothetical protein
MDKASPISKNTGWPKSDPRRAYLGLLDLPAKIQYEVLELREHLAFVEKLVKLVFGD